MRPHARFAPSWYGVDERGLASDVGGGLAEYVRTRCGADPFDGRGSIPGGADRFRTETLQEIAGLEAGDIRLSEELLDESQQLVEPHALPSRQVAARQGQQ